MPGFEQTDFMVIEAGALKGVEARVTYHATKAKAYD